jgi:hypothetical protein
MYSKKISFLILLIFFFCGCKKEKIEFNAIPSIEFVSITPTSAMQYSDAVTITIKYEDGDGDLGENNANAKNCYVTDNRIGITYSYRIQQLAPSNSSVPITGNLNIELGGQVITDSSSQQSVNYTVYVVDRAGHQSNSVTTGAVSIHQ